MGVRVDSVGVLGVGVGLMVEEGVLGAKERELESS